MSAKEKVVTLESLKNLVDQLPADRFMRVHKSYIVNTALVKSIEGNRLLIEDHKIPISRSKKSEVFERIFG